MKYEKQRILTNDENPNGGRDYEASVPFLAGATVLTWDSDESDYGHNDNSLAPAFSSDTSVTHDPQGRCWLHTWAWCPAEGYSATGHGACLLPYEEGVRLLIDRGSFEFPPADTPPESP